MSGDGQDGTVGASSPRCVEDRVQPASLDAALEGLARGATRWVKAADGSAWLVSERWAVSRFPALPSPPPSDAAARSLFAQPGVWLLDYLLPAGEERSANAWLYLFEGERYSIDALAKNGRRDARKALRELEIGWITHAQLMANGLSAFVDCRSRAGLSDGTADHFARRFGPLRDVPGCHYLGAWKDGTLAAFMTVQAVERWAWIAAYSHSAYRGSCPNDGLIHVALNHCVNERGIHLISYGLSSVQEESRAASLHEFKLKAGFKAVPIRRVFSVHPRLAPVINRGTTSIVHLLGRALPRSRMIKKASGVLAQLLPGSGAAGARHDDDAP